MNFKDHTYRCEITTLVFVDMIFKFFCKISRPKVAQRQTLMTLFWKSQSQWRMILVQVTKTFLRLLYILTSKQVVHSLFAGQKIFFCWFSSLFLLKHVFFDLLISMFRTSQGYCRPHRVAYSTRLIVERKLKSLQSGNTPCAWELTMIHKQGHY